MRWSLSTVTLVLMGKLLFICSFCFAQGAELQVSLTTELKQHSRMLYAVDETGAGKEFSVYGRGLTQDSLSVIAKHPVNIIAVEYCLFTDLSPLKANKLDTLAAYFGYGIGMSLQGADVLTNMPLTVLGFKYSGLTDFGFLKGLPNLQRLTLMGENHLTDLSFVGLMNLDSLSISGTGVTNLSALADSSLEMLDISGCRISDLSPLSGLPLRVVNLSWTDVTDLSPLKNAPLKKLYLEDTPVQDLSILGGADLEFLQLSGISSNVLSTLSVRNLKHLVVSYFELNEDIIKLLADVPRLETLNYKEWAAVISEFEANGVGLSGSDP